MTARQGGAERPAGIAPEACISRVSCRENLRIPRFSLPVPRRRDAVTDRHGLAAVVARPARHGEAWISLSEPVVLAILVLAGSAGVVEAPCLQPSS